MKKIFLYLFFLITLLLTLKILIVLLLQSYLSNLLNQNIELKNITLFPLNIETTSLGGNTQLNYLDEKFILTMKKVSLLSFEKINKTTTRKKMIVQKGTVSGTLNYNPFTNIYNSNLIAKDTIINGIDLDKKLRLFNDVLGFNIISLFRHFLKNLDTSNKVTHISHFQFNITLNDNLISLHDVAFTSKNFRIALFGKVHGEGYIDNFQAHLVDKNGCSIISQELTGNIKDPKIRKTKTFQKIVKTVPISMFNTGMKIVNFTKYNLRAVMPKNQAHITHQFLSKSDIMFQKTSKIVMPGECKVIYTGNVTHPKAYKKGFI